MPTHISQPILGLQNCTTKAFYLLPVLSLDLQWPWTDCDPA